MPPIVLAALLQIADAAPPPVRRSSADDCAIMVLAGKEKLGWGSDLSSYSFAGNRYAPDGSPTYVVDCAWRDFGIVPPEQSLGNGRGRASSRPLLTNPNWTSTIFPPRYDESGMKASATVGTSKWQGEVRGLATQSWTCNFAHTNGLWTLSGCKEIGATAR
jgi:hypothetical protein